MKNQKNYPNLNKTEEKFVELKNSYLIQIITNAYTSNAKMFNK